MNLHRLSTLLTAIIFLQSGLSGQESTVEKPTVLTEEKSASPTGGSQKLYKPSLPSQAERRFKEPPAFDVSQWIAPISVLLLLIGTLIFLQKKGYFGLNRHTAEGKLRIKDQIMLGNRQFLVVVEYGGKEILVGIGPGFIRHVCSLTEENSSSDEMQGKFDDLLEDKIESESSEN